MRADFETVYRESFGKREILKELRSLLEEVFNSLNSEPVNLAYIKDSFVSLFTFLCEPKNRTDENCINIDWFFTIFRIYEKWRSSEKYPDQYKQLLTNMMSLHDTFYDPEVAISFESTPEQLLAQAKELTV